MMAVAEAARRVLAKALAGAPGWAEGVALTRCGFGQWRVVPVRRSRFMPSELYAKRSWVRLLNLADIRELRRAEMAYFRRTGRVPPIRRSFVLLRTGQFSECECGLSISYVIFRP